MPDSTWYKSAQVVAEKRAQNYHQLSEELWAAGQTESAKFFVACALGEEEIAEEYGKMAKRMEERETVFKALIKDLEIVEDDK